MVVDCVAGDVAGLAVDAAAVGDGGVGAAGVDV